MSLIFQGKLQSPFEINEYASTEMSIAFPGAEGPSEQCAKESAQQLHPQPLSLALDRLWAGPEGGRGLVFRQRRCVCPAFLAVCGMCH